MAAKPRDDNLLNILCNLIVDHQIGLSVNLLLLLSLTHLCFPRARQTTRSFFELSYYDPTSDAYTQGWKDVPFVVFWVVGFTGIRVAIMDYFIKPLAKLGGITKRKAIIRFQEQAWLLIYYAVFWILGIYIMYNSKYWFKLRELWTGFPTRSMSGILKWYYLVQLAFCLQQILVVNIEEKRKDYVQMFTHHIITSSLIITSYVYYQTKVGNTILCIADVTDILISAAKLLRYLGYQTACDITFGIFIVTWFLTRHVFFLAVYWSIHADVPTTMPYGCYDSATGAEILASHTNWPRDGGNGVLSNIFQSFRDPGGIVCFNPRIRHGFLALLLALQVLMLLWFAMIVRVAWKVIQGRRADDVRSDKEDSSEEIDTEIDNEKKICSNITASTGTSPAAGVPFEEEFGVEGLNLRRRKTPSVGARRTAKGRNGLSITRERKELLGQIGCDRPS